MVSPRLIWTISKPSSPANTEAGMNNQRKIGNLSRNPMPSSSNTAMKMNAGIMG
jgi:hypothetical protein